MKYILMPTKNIDRVEDILMIWITIVDVTSMQTKKKKLINSKILKIINVKCKILCKYCFNMLFIPYVFATV